VCAVALQAIAAASQARPTAELDRPFKLPVGSSATIADQPLQIGFERVLSDSRCPEGVQCIVAGEAVVRVWLQHASARRDTRELKTTPTGSTVEYGDYRVILVSLAPAPSVKRAVRPSEYVAVLTVMHR
jgi:hypothetical protein